MSGARALWIPFELPDIRPARQFYQDRLGLSEVDSWSTATEQGSVLEVASGAFIELVSPARHRDGMGPLAFEMRTTAEVDSRLAAIGRSGVKRPPGRYPRGHYGFEVTGPGGADLMVWTEERSGGER